MELYRKVRLACAGGMSKRAVARHFNISRETVNKALAFSVPPGYRRTAPIKRPKLDAFIPIIDAWLDGDREAPAKQRHTAKRVFDRLRAEQGFTGGYTIVKDYVRERERRKREMFVPLAHPPGHAQADFGEAVAIIGGIEQKACFLVCQRRCKFRPRGGAKVGHLGHGAGRVLARGTAASQPRPQEAGG